jgi:hypothetical protein
LFIGAMIAWMSSMTRTLAVTGVLCGWATALGAQQPLCMPATGLTRLAGASEASGVALSRRTPGILWSHNDSGEPVLFAFDTSGKPRGRVQVTGATVDDWEDLAVGPCAQGSCLFIGDIGDNNRSRRQITIYRVPEPRPEDKATAPAEALHATYPDGPHDAEALFVTPAGQFFLISKDDAQSTALYRLGQTPAGRVGKLERVTKMPLDHVTGAGASPNGNLVAVRTNHELFFYRMQDLIGGGNAQPRRFDLKALREPQGEGVAVGADGLIYLAGEGGGSGSFAILRCNLSLVSALR